jgi:hypothetical protein
LNFYRYPGNPLRRLDPWGLDPADLPEPKITIGKAKSWWDNINDILHWKKFAEEGRQIRIKEATLICKKNREIDERVANDQLTPEEAKLAKAANQVAVHAANGVSKAIEEIQANRVEQIAVTFGYFTPGDTSCNALLGPIPSTSESVPSLNGIPVTPQYDPNNPTGIRF